MNKEIIESKVKDALIEVLGGKKEDITSEKLLVDDLGMDSFAALELIFALEESLGIEITKEDAQQFLTVNDVCIYVYNALEKEGRSPTC